MFEARQVRECGEDNSRFLAVERLVKTALEEVEKRNGGRGMMRSNSYERSVKMFGLRYRLLRSGYSCSQTSKCNLRTANSGFTVIEILVVVVIIAIAAMMVIPMMTSAAGVQIRSAADMIAADLEYAKSMAINRQKNYAVVFDESNESYQIEDASGVIEHPVKKGFAYIVEFRKDSRVSKVNISNVDFDADPSDTIKFDYMGTPKNGSDAPLNSGVITLEAEGVNITINVEAVTGFISISN